jgi:[ribosomal protein S5]-alanine N-acetyltransferase
VSKTLETPRLLLRPMVASDAAELLHIFQDPLVMAAFNSPLFTRKEMERWVGRNIEHQDKNGYGLYSVILKESGLLIGDCGLEQMEIGGEVAAELGYDFRSDHWNRGFATEAARAVRDHAFGALGLPRLVSLIRVGNEPSRRVAEKVGMRLAAEITRYGTPYWEYALDHTEYQAQVDE